MARLSDRVVTGAPNGILSNDEPIQWYAADGITLIDGIKVDAAGDVYLAPAGGPTKVGGALDVTGNLATGGDVTIENATPILDITYTGTSGRIDFNNSSDAVKSRIIYTEGTGLKIGANGTAAAITIADATNNVAVSGTLTVTGNISGDDSILMTADTAEVIRLTRTGVNAATAELSTSAGFGSVVLTDAGGTTQSIQAFGNEMRFDQGGTTRMTIESDGDFKVVNEIWSGTWSTAGATSGVRLTETGFIGISRTGTSAATQQGFYNGNGRVGRIDTSGSTTTYLTSSDPRLKSEFKPITGASEMILEAREQGVIGEFTFLADPTQTIWGYNAHKLIDAQPNFGGSEGEGSRDAPLGGDVTEAGVDQSKRVPILEAAIGELLDRIKALEGNV